MRLRKVAPIGTRLTSAFVSREDGCGGLEEVVMPEYPDDGGAGERFRARRVAAGLLLRQAAAKLGLTAEEVSGLEFGRYVPEGGWDALYAALEAP